MYRRHFQFELRLISAQCALLLNFFVFLSVAAHKILFAVSVGKVRAIDDNNVTIYFKRGGFLFFIRNVLL